MMANIKVQQDKNILTIEVPKDTGSKFVEAMLVESKNWLLLPVDVFVFDFKDVVEMLPSAYRPFVVFARLAKQGQKNVASLHLSHQLDLQVKRDGVITSFNPFVSIAEAKEKLMMAPVSAVKPSGSMDVALINPFIDAVVNTFSVQAQTQCTPGKAFLQNAADKNYDPTIGIVGMINIVSSKVDGSIALAFNEKVFLQIYENMFAEKHESITSELQDAAAEILNIIYGTVKATVNKTTDYNLQPAIPTVFVGEKIKINQKTNDKIIILPFQSSAGAFQMEIAMQKK